MIKRCSKCGTQAVDEQSLFCNKCGTQLPVSIPEKKGEVCPICNAEITDKNSRVCAQCNSPLFQKTVLVKPARPVKICPHCKEPVFDENRYYCKKCGAYIHATESSTHSLEKSSLKQLGNKPVIIPGIYQNTQTTKIERDEPEVIKKPIIPIKPKMKIPKVNPFIILFVIAGVIILAWAGISLSGSGNSVITGGNVGNNLPSDNDLLISQDLSSMALTINDLPQGWISRGGSDTGNAYSAQFEKMSEESPALVELNIARYGSTDASRQQFTSLRAQASGFDIETLNLGNEGFGFIDVDYVVVIFRKENIVVTIEDTRYEYQFDTTINNAKNYAQIVANRIQ
ncbi:MAG: zinc ribbon domain-containing protein [Methanoregula sp.]|nr:zinc ribbon domain-containing protein [Methanoregula sp.]